MQMKIVNAIVFVLLVATQVAFSQNDECRLNMGINLAGPADWGAEWPFVDIMKYGREWETTNSEWVGNGLNLWNTELIEYFEFDEQGYPLEVPLNIDHPNADGVPQIIRSVWANTFALPEGVYVLLYDGEGVIEFDFDGTIISQEPGRIEVQMTHSGQIMSLLIMESTPGNHIRNIRFLLPGTEATYQENPWQEDFIDKLEPFNTFRFMDWGRTNNSNQRKWEDRPQLDDYTYNINGNPYERWIELCNMMQADAWICVPHLADEDYIIQMATLFKTQLDPDLKIYVEYSNELWNWIFDQAHYGLDSLDQNLEWPERLGPRVAEVMDIWTQVFDGQTDRLVRVMGGMHGWFDITDRVFGQIQANGQDHLIDAISPAAYIPLDSEQLAGLGSAATGVDVIEGATEIAFDENNWAMQGWRDHATLANANNKQLIFYEGGQHFTPEPWGTVQPYNMALIEAQVVPEMYDLYNQLFTTLLSLTDSEMTLMHFSFIAPLGEVPEDVRWGTFGALTDQFNQGEPFSDAPKYRALRDYITACDITSNTADLTAQGFTFDVAPNPATNSIEVKIEGVDVTAGRFRLIQANGTLVQQGTFNKNSFQLSLTSLAKGMYWIELQTEEGNLMKKIVKQ